MATRVAMRVARPDRSRDASIDSAFSSGGARSGGAAADGTGGDGGAGASIAGVEALPASGTEEFLGSGPRSLMPRSRRGSNRGGAPAMPSQEPSRSVRMVATPARPTPRRGARALRYQRARDRRSDRSPDSDRARGAPPTTAR